ncbi:MAG TPA: DUF6249 domain-containing protein [Bacteroidota bacterium]|nr:DUF6249 domain-containing protein [Bacteroidota bacterium]
MEPAAVVFIVFGSVGFVLYTWIQSRHKERMSMIDKGVKASELKGSIFPDILRPNPLSSLKWGLLAMFVGAGLIVANILDRYFYFHESVYFASMLIAGGIGLVIFYFVASKKMKDESL